MNCKSTETRRRRKRCDTQSPDRTQNSNLGASTENYVLPRNIVLIQGLVTLGRFERDFARWIRVDCIVLRRSFCGVGGMGVCLDAGGPSAPLPTSPNARTYSILDALIADCIGGARLLKVTSTSTYVSWRVSHVLVRQASVERAQVRNAQILRRRSHSKAFAARRLLCR